MKRAGSISNTAPKSPVLEARLRDVGLLVVHCSVKGEIMAPPQHDDWLVDLFCSSPVFHRALTDAADTWIEAADAGAVELLAGVWVVPHPHMERRQVAGWSVTVIPTDELPRSEILCALCQATGADVELMSRRLEKLPTVARQDVPRITSLVADAHRVDYKAQHDGVALESVSRELAESYEEISLLYTMIQSMRSVDRPDRFMRIAAEELLGTLSYRWVGVMLVDDPDRLKRLAGRFIHAGVFPAPVKDVRTAARALLEQVIPDAPQVLQPTVNPAHASYSVLGHSSLVHPVCADGRVLGVFIAGDKEGDDVSASSADMKLLGATANHTAIFIENAKLYDDLNAMMVGTLEALSASIDAKDRYTCGHSERVAQLTQQLAEAAGFDERVVARFRIAGLVHDVGKIGVPEAVLTKPGRLNEEEFAWIRKHPEIGFRILRDIPNFDDITPGVLHHHERWDGHGYPNGLSGEDIPPVARLIALADCFDAMSSDRTYRKRMTREQVFEEVRRCSGTQFDPDLVPIFLALDFTEFDRMVEAHHALESLGDVA